MNKLTFTGLAIALALSASGTRADEAQDACYDKADRALDVCSGQAGLRVGESMICSRHHDRAFAACDTQAAARDPLTAPFPGWEPLPTHFGSSSLPHDKAFGPAEPAHDQ
jgi:hypothetical protein